MSTITEMELQSNLVIFNEFQLSSEQIPALAVSLAEHLGLEIIANKDMYGEVTFEFKKKDND